MCKCQKPVENLMRPFVPLPVLLKSVHGDTVTKQNDVNLYSILADVLEAVYIATLQPELCTTSK